MTTRTDNWTARVREVFFAADGLFVDTVTIASNGVTAADVRVRLVKNPVSIAIGGDEVVGQHATCTINKADITLVSTRAGDWGTVTDADATVWRIIRIERETDAIYHVALELLTTKQFGRATALPRQ